MPAPSAFHFFGLPDSGDLQRSHRLADVEDELALGVLVGRTVKELITQTVVRFEPALG